MRKYQGTLVILLGLLWSTLASAQSVQFVETTDIQRAMTEYKNRYSDDTELAGYRIQYLFTTDRRQMENTERAFINLYRKIPHEWEHDQPYYRLYAGSFVDRSKAMRLLMQIRENFPGALLVNAPVTIASVLECREILN